jgi:hypothetical protein
LRTWWVALEDGGNQLRAVGNSAEGVVVEDTLTQTFVPRTATPPAQWLTHVAATTWRGESALRLTVQMADAAGTPILDQEQRVAFQVTSADGQLLGDLGTIDGSYTVETANGRASILLSHKGTTVITVRITSDRLPALEFGVNEFMD